MTDLGLNPSIDYYMQNNGRKFKNCTFIIDSNGNRKLKYNKNHYIEHIESSNGHIYKKIKKGYSETKIIKPIGRDFYKREITFLHNSLLKSFRLMFKFDNQTNGYKPILTKKEVFYGNPKLKIKNQYLKYIIKQLWQ